MTSLDISDLCCEHCATVVENALRTVPGVTEVTVDLGEKRAQLEGEFDLSAAKAAVVAAGHAVE